MKKFLPSLFPSLFFRTAVITFATSALGVTLQAQSTYTPVTFTTLAGAHGSSGANDGTGTAARFNNPSGVAVDASGGVIVADLVGGMIRRVTPSGSVSTIAGSPNATGQGNADGQGTSAKFNYPVAVAVAPSGVIYVSDEHNCTIRSISTGGYVSTLAGTVGTPVGSPVLGSADGTGSAASFRYPFGIGVDSAGNVFVCDTGNSTVRKITPSGVVTTFAGLAETPGSVDGTGSSARFMSPTGLAIDGADNIYVSDYSDNTIRKITPAGVVTTVAGVPGTLGSADGIGANAQFRAPYGLAVDAAGNLYIGDQSNQTIRKMTPHSGVSTIGGTAQTPGWADGLGSSARFANPAGVAVSSTGILYVADESNQVIRKAVVGFSPRDFNHDGKPDITWQNTATGEFGFWLMNGTTFVSWIDVGSISTDWHIAASADFNGDGQPDLMWENTTTGDRYVWFLSGTTVTSSTFLGNVSTDWHIAAVADFNADNQADLVWENTVTGDRGFWLMNGTTFASWVDVGVIPTALRIVGVGDFNGDGKPDLVWENTSTGKRVIWLMNGTTFVSSVNLGIVSTDWHIAAVADYDGDGQADLLWENKVTGERYFWLMNGTTFGSGVSLGVVSTDWRIAN